MMACWFCRICNNKSIFNRQHADFEQSRFLSNELNPSKRRRKDHSFISSFIHWFIILGLTWLKNIFDMFLAPVNLKFTMTLRKILNLIVHRQKHFFLQSPSFVFCFIVLCIFIVFPSLIFFCPHTGIKLRLLRLLDKGQLSFVAKGAKEQHLLST